MFLTLLKSDIKVGEKHELHVCEMIFQSVCRQLGIIQHVKVSINLRIQTSDSGWFYQHSHVQY